MNTSPPSENSFPLADATLTIPPERIERMTERLTGHGATMEPQGNDRYKVLFPAGTRCFELLLRYPKQYRVLLPDGYSFLVLDPLQEEGQQQERQ